MTDDTAHAADANGWTEPGGADEVAEARFAERTMRHEGVPVSDAAAPVSDVAASVSDVAASVSDAAASVSDVAGPVPDVAAPVSDAAAPVSAVLDVPVDRQLEAILMIADEPQSLLALATAVGSPVAVVRQAIERLVADFDGEDGGIRRGFELREVGGGWRFYVRADLDPVVDQFVQTENPSRLSQAALETLAVVAYKQPVTRSQIASIRAVNVDGVVRTLVARGLIAESFTDSETGAINYVTTDLLLVQLGINSLDELPLISPLLEDGAEGFNDGRV